MPSGGARARSGPAPDPNALRRGRANDAEWTTLPIEGRKGRAPKFPLPDRGLDDDGIPIPGADAELELWGALWKKPQAVMWQRLGMQFQVAAYTRACIESVAAGASAGLKVAVLRMEGELGLSVPGMNALRWKIARNEVAEQRDAAEVVTEQTGAQTARERLRVIRAS